MAGERGEDNLLQQCFFRSVRAFPDNIAVTFSGDTVESITYSDLGKKVENLSIYFKTIFTRNEIIGIYSCDCFNLPAILLAVMNAMAAFYPLSTAIQLHKVWENITNRSVRYILVENESLQNFLRLSHGEHDTSKASFAVIDNDLLREAKFTLLKVVNRSQPCLVSWSRDIVYVMETSGTTGDPKAVFVPHTCIIPNIVDLSSMFKVTTQDVVYLASPYTFDPSMVQMFLAFSNGAELLITPQTTKLIPEKLCQTLINQHHVTILQATPSLLYYIGEDLVGEKLLSESSTLSVLAIGGESCPSLSTLRKWKHPKSKTKLYNIYGITEVSSWATCHYITDDELNVAVDDGASELNGGFNTCELGLPLSQTELIVYDDNGDLVLRNGVGHLWIGGKDRQCLLEGETEDKIPIIRDSGDIVEIRDDRMWYLGRSDNQIKRFGHRINLDYIERIVQENTGVTSCILVIEPASTCGALLHLCAVSNLSKEDGLVEYMAALRERIKAVLPRSSQPDHVHLVTKLPLTSHGKVDKNKVLKSVMDRTPCYNGDLPVGAALSQMWRDSVGHVGSSSILDEKSSLKPSKNSLQTPLSGPSPQLQQVKPDAMFMLHGGNSMLAVQLAERVEKWMKKRCSQPLDLSMLFEVITNKPFGYLVTYVEEILQSNVLEISHSTELDVTAVENRKRSSYTNEEPTAKISKGDTDMVSEIDVQQLLQETGLVRKNQTCTCFARRGSEKFTCSQCDNNTSGCFVFRKKTQPIQELSLKWSVCMEKCIDASPLVVPSCLNGEGVVFIASHSFLFLSVLLSNGEVLWRTRLGGRVESSACLSRCGQMIVVGCYDGKIYVLARNNGKITWAYQTQDVVKSSPCVDQKTGFIWVGSHDGSLYCLDIDQKVCKVRVKCEEGSCFSSPTISYDPHNVYIATLAGCFLCVDAISGEIKWCKRLGKPIFSSPFTQGDNVFVATVNGCFKCFSLSGEDVWELRVNDQVFSSPVGITSRTAPKDDEIILASHSNIVYNVSSDGKCRWSTKVDGPVYATPCFISCTYSYDSTTSESPTEQCSGSSSVSVVIVTTTGTIYLLESRNGKIFKTFSLPGEVFSSPVVVGRDIVIGCRNNYLYCITAI